MKRFPRGHLVSTAMPATRHDLALHLARSQRQSLVETAIFHGIDRSVDVEQRNLPARDGHGRACPRREFVKTRCLNEVMHCLCPALEVLKSDLCDADPAYHKLRKIGCFLRSLDLGAASADRRFEFHKPGQQFIRSHNETLSVAAMCVCNPDRSPVMNIIDDSCTNSDLTTARSPMERC
jgi:hypothetical protein